MGSSPLLGLFPLEVKAMRNKHKKGEKQIENVIDPKF